MVNIYTKINFIIHPIDKIGERDNNYDQFLEDLMAKDGEADDCRYAIYDYEYVVHSQGTEPSNR